MPSRRQCSASKHGGGQCTGPAVKGTVPARCRMHGGNQQKDKDIRALVSEWKLGDETLDPVQVMLATVTVAWLRFTEAQQAYDRAIEATGYDDATVGTAYGEGGVTGEYIRGLAENMHRWWDRSLKASATAVSSGLAERQVKLAEKQGALVAELLALAFDAAGCDKDQKERAYGAVRSKLSLAS